MKSKLQRLNKEQLEAVRHFNGPCLVIAGPGTGKTTIITHRVLYLIKEYRVKPHEILVVTFTKAAAKEMENRFFMLSNYQNECKGVTFGTFHSIFFKILRAYNDYRLEDLIDEKEKHFVVKSIIKGLGHNFYEDEQTIESIISEMSYIQNTLIDIEDFKSSSVDNNIFKDIRREYEKYKNINRKYDYDDMLSHCYKLLLNNEKILDSIREKYKHILIDEFQDINKIQYEIMRMIAYPRNNIFIVGDDDQSIYSFRGADADIMFQFSRTYKAVPKIILRYNYRSHRAIINSAMSLIGNNKNRYEKNFVTTKSMGINPYVVRVEDFEEEAKVISEKIKNMVKQGAKYSDFAVIYRTNLQSRAFVDAFTIANIPYVSYDGLASIYNHWLLKDILSYFKASLGIDTNNSLLRIINKPNRYIARHVIEESLNKDGDLIENIIKSGLLNELQVRGLYQLKDSLLRIKDMQTSKAAKYIRSFIGYEEYVREYAHAKSIDFRLFKDLMEEISSSAEKFANISDYIQHVNNILESVGNRYKDKSNNNAVSLMTMHKAKGLEFEQVFISGAVDGIIPYLKEENITSADLEDERRLFYVAMTRAKAVLHIFVPKQRFSKKVSPSRFIGEIDGWLKDYRDSFRCGDMINHKYFGEGIIKEIYNKSDEYTIIVEFKNGLKKLNLDVLIKNKIISLK
ncbi:ATP-dependent helicase [Lutispora sp.]|uniref:ATP-dependent helicase n=1 Tax=Lutispora sp. TaxID=2828727 RepID=UPI00356A32D3